MIRQPNELLECAHAAVRTGSANTFHSQELGGLTDQVGIAVLAQHHRNGTVPPKKEGTKDVFVPKHQNVFPFGIVRIDSWIVKRPLEVNRSDQ